MRTSQEWAMEIIVEVLKTVEVRNPFGLPVPLTGPITIAQDRLDAITALVDRARADDDRSPTDTEDARG